MNKKFFDKKFSIIYSIAFSGAILLDVIIYIIFKFINIISGFAEIFLFGYIFPSIFFAINLYFVVLLLKQKNNKLDVLALVIFVLSFLITYASMFIVFYFTDF